MSNLLLPAGHIKVIPRKVNYDPRAGGVGTPVAPSPPPPTCFPAGSTVMMADRTLKLIEDIVITDLLMGADGNPVKIIDIETPILGSRRLLSFEEDMSMKWSDEHAIWAKKNDQQWWWTGNHANWLAEVEAGAIGGLKDNYSHFVDLDVEFAHISGFVRRTVVDVTEYEDADHSTQLYLPITETAVPIIVNGYVVGAGLNEFKYDYKTLDWNEVRKTI